MSKLLLAVGTYTDKADHVPDARGEGVEILSFDEKTGSFSRIHTISGLINPTYLDWNEKTSSLFVIEENLHNDGRISRFSIDCNGSFSKDFSVTGPGMAGCHLSVNSAGNLFYGASYGSGSICGYDLDKDSGSPMETGRVSYEGNGPNLQRQEASHAHQILFGPEEKRIYTCDLGTDRIHLHSLATGLEPVQCALELPPGYGPRHMVFDPTGNFAFILCELLPRLIVASLDHADGTMSIIQDLELPSGSFKGTPAPAALRIHPSGKTLALSNRFADRIEVYELNREGDSLKAEWIEGFSCGGKTPRDICFSPSGEWLFIANQDSHNIALKSFDGKSGNALSGETDSCETGSPVCVVVTHSQSSPNRE